jgi:putative ABC transport system permease protein
VSTCGLIWANLFRKRTRTVLTLLSVIVAFLLFMLLRAIAVAFSGGADVIGVDRLVVAGKYSAIDNLPYTHVRAIEAMDGVEAVTHANWFGGVYQDPVNFFPKFPVKPRSYFAMFEEMLIDPEALERFESTRTGAVASRGLAERFGWKVGDAIPIQGDIWQREDGSRLWEFELVGIYDWAPGQGSQQTFLMHYDYFNEAVAFYGKDQVGWITVRVTDPERAAELASEIDRLFENSADPTRSTTEDEYSRQFAAQLGDMGFITTMILGAVFFTIVLLTANTMSQALRERIPELAVLKTLGFTDGAVSALVLGEAVLLCLVGGALGIGIALLLEPGLNALAVQFIGRFEMTLPTIAMAFAMALAVGLVIGALPALTAKRLTITDALRRH